MQKFLNNAIYRSHFIVVGLFTIFVFFRLYQLPNSLQFWGDIGRDLHVLYQTVQTGKIPLLGPSISFLPLNQSPLYYYLYYPLFYLSNFSPYTTVVTGVWLYGLLWWGLVAYRNQLKLPKGALLVIGVIVAIHPEFIRQLRPPWNPSLAFPFILGSVLALRLLVQEYSVKLGWIFCVGLAVAMGLSYSVVPIVVSLLGILLWQYRKKPRLQLRLISQLAVSLGIVFAPIIVFELRYGFPMLRNLFTSLSSGIGSAVPTWLKFDQLFSYLSGVFYYPHNAIATHFVWIVLLLNCLLIARTHLSREKDRQFLQMISWFAIGLGFTLLAPFEIHSHYIFGLMSLLLVTIIFLRLRFQIILLTALLIWWLHPIQADAYFQKTERNVASLEHCAKLICQQETEPMYLTMQAWHTSHFAGEHLFLWNRAGCLVRDPIQTPNWSNRMAVIADNSTYIHGQSSFHELTVFGESREITRYTCSEMLQVHILEQK